ncbi:MAG: 2-C-methyl-D-erythritol 4-phosphate cytidylyltransferase [Erysipelotrichaceae bacterium]
MDYSVVIVAAGSGSRMNLGYNKVFYKVNNQTILDRTINCFKKDRDCKQVIVVTNKEYFNEVSAGVEVVEGGTNRQDSVYNGLKKVTQKYVMIHDGARPHLKLDLIEAIKTSLTKHDACLLMVPCKDTIKVVREGYCEETLDRNTLYQAQTPQAFKYEVIMRAFEKIDSNEVYFDDASVVEKNLGVKVAMVMGDYENIKITTQEDITSLNG